ncbi:MAG: pyridoxal phosphate-dependent aminotransferase [Lachnospiraceae bacterium]
MVAQKYKDMLQKKSVIRTLSEFATKRGQEIGYENVFDYSLGNPSVPVVQDYTDNTIRLLQTKTSSELHGYSPSVGLPSFKEKVAASLNKRFDMNYTANHIFPTSGAAGALAHALRAVTSPDDVLTFAPYFQSIPGLTGANLRVVPANTADFQVDFEQFEKMLTSNVSAVLINTPNNPSGAVYSAETLKKLAQLMEDKQKEYGHDIFIISDEPYREIVFDGKKAPYVSKFYDNTLSCYSFSKSLSLPGERIGYVAVNPTCTDADLLVPMMSQISRGIGHNCPSSLIMMGVEDVLDETSDMTVYETNMNLLYDKLIELGFSCVRPSGTFYIFPKALEEDAVAFCNKALKYDLVLVPSDSFGCPGYFRMAYCIDTEKVVRSLDALERFVKTEYPDR